MASYVLSRATITYLDVSVFKPEEDAKKLKDAMKGAGTDNRAIIDILGYRTNEQRQVIREAFCKLYGKDLMHALKEELQGPFEDIIIALMTPTAEYDAQLIKKSLEGFGTDEDLLTEILFTRTDFELYRITQAYDKLYGHDMVKAVESETSGDFRKLCSMLILRGGDHNVPEEVDRVQAVKDAETLYKAGEGKLGTDESGFFNILTGRTYAHLNLVFDEYMKHHSSSIEKAIKGEFGGVAQTALLEFVRIIRSTDDFFAERLHKSIMETKDNTTTTRIIVTRSEIDLTNIKKAFANMYRKELRQCVEEYVMGPTRVMLEVLLG